MRAVASHADFLEVSRDTPMEKTLYAVDELSGFVMACAYVRPQGIHGLTPKSVKKKMKSPAFAAAVNRDGVREGAEELGVDFDEHVAFVIAALEPHADALGLSGSSPRLRCVRHGGLLKIIVLEGDETGQELLEQALRVLDPDVLGLELELERFDLSLENAARDGQRGRPRGGAGDARGRLRHQGRDDHARGRATTSARRTGSCARRSTAR